MGKHMLKYEQQRSCNGSNGSSRLMQGSQTESCVSSAVFCVLPRNFLLLLDEDNKSSTLGNYVYPYILLVFSCVM
jgi:hypothetical protein